LQLNQQNQIDSSLLTEQQQIQTLLAKHPDMLKPFDKQVSDCIINFFIKISCPIVDQQQQQQQPQAVQNESLSKRCLNLFQIAVSNDIWPNADIKLEFFDKILCILEVNNNSTSGSVTNQSPQANSQNGGTQQQTNTTAQQTQTAQPNYSSICTVIEMVIFLVENASGSLVKIQNIFRTIQRGMTACLMSSNSRVIRSMSNLIQKLMSILPSDIFNSNPNVASVSVAATSALSQVTDKSTLTSTALVNSPGSLNNISSDASHLDAIYQLFGQPDGKLSSTFFKRINKFAYKIN
jgi:hypothetical protein